MSLLYTPPEGFVDAPFAWVYDLNNPNGQNVPLTNGQNYPNQFISIDSGWGDFILRRIAGLDRALNNAASGQYQIRDMIGRYLQSLPTCVGLGGPVQPSQSTAQIAIVPEVPYKELSQIRFDLFDIKRASDGSQVIFQGVRRVARSVKPAPPYKARPFTYVFQTILTGSLLQQTYEQISDYDFDLYEIYIFYNTLLELAAEGEAFIQVVPVLSPANFPPQDTTIYLNASGPNQIFNIEVTGPAIVVTLATNGLSGVLTSGFELQAAIAANPATSQLISINVLSGGLNASPSTPGPEPVVGATSDPNLSQAQVLLFDQNIVQTYSAPMLDLFVNAASYYKNGAIVPPLFYQRNSRLRMDFYNAPNTLATILYVGHRRIPCS
jgi:hypothetical protein